MYFSIDFQYAFMDIAHMTDAIPTPLISPEKFIWEKYISRRMIATTELFDNAYSANCALNPEWEVIGYCAANRLIVRPRSDGYAVLLRHKETGEETWLHDPIFCLKKH